MDLLLADRVAVVTGGTSGVGRVTAELLLAEGMLVAFCARDAARVEAVALELSQTYGDRVLGVAADVLDATAMGDFASRVEECFGRTDVLVNNAGTARMRPLDDLTDQDWTDELALKFFGLLRPTRAFLAMLWRSDAAAMVYVSSLLAKQPEARLISTSAARAGALNLAKSLALEYAPAVRVNAILLGVIDTGQWERRWQERVALHGPMSREDYHTELARERDIPMGRIGRPDEIAAAIAFLASPRSGFTTGAVLEISGGVSRFV